VAHEPLDEPVEVGGAVTHVSLLSSRSLEPLSSPGCGAATSRPCWNTSRALRIPSAPRADTVELVCDSRSDRNDDPGRRVGRLGFPPDSASTGRGVRASVPAGAADPVGPEELGERSGACLGPEVGRRGRAPGSRLASAGATRGGGGGAGCGAGRCTGSWLAGRRRLGGIDALLGTVVSLSVAVSGSSSAG